MESVDRVQNITIKYTVILGLLILASNSIFQFGDKISVMLGLFLGISISIINFVLLAGTLKKAVQMAPQNAQSYTIKRYFFRYIVNAITVCIAVTQPYISIIATVIGMSLIKVVIFATNLFDDKEFYKNIFKRREV